MTKDRKISLGIAAALCFLAGSVFAEQSPLQMWISVDQSTWTRDQPFPVHLVAINRSNRWIGIETDFVFKKKPPVNLPSTELRKLTVEKYYPKFDLTRVQDRKRKWISIYGPESPMEASIFPRPQPLIPDTNHHLMPGEKFKTTINLNEWKPTNPQELTKGLYELQARWSGPIELDGKPIADKPSSNILRIELKD